MRGHMGMAISIPQSGAQYTIPARLLLATFPQSMCSRAHAFTCFPDSRSRQRALMRAQLYVITEGEQLYNSVVAAIVSQLFAPQVSPSRARPP